MLWLELMTSFTSIRFPLYHSKIEVGAFHLSWLLLHGVF